jgi:DNA-binding PadR family transcriptional regulator
MQHPHHEPGGPFGAHRQHHPRGGFGPGGPGFGAGGFRGGPGGRHAGPGGRHGRGRAGRGDVRAAVLSLLAQEPMHGYQLMQAIAERSGGRWRPSPGAIYPTINQLEDEGLVTVTADSGRKLVTLTDIGREQATAVGDPFAGFATEGPGVDLRGLIEQLHGAVRQVARSGTEAQVATAAQIIGEARRALYLLLADGPGSQESQRGESQGG